MTKKVLSLSQHINRIFFIYTLVIIAFISILASILTYKSEKKATYDKMDQLTEMFVNLSDTFFKKYDNAIIEIKKKPSISDENIMLSLINNPFIDSNDNFYIVNKELSISSTKPQYKGLIHFSMRGFDVFQKKPVSDVYQSIFTGKSVVANLYDLSNRSMLVIERDLNNFIPIASDFNQRFAFSDSFFFILSGNGEIVYHPDKKLMDARHNLGFELQKYISKSPSQQTHVIYLNNEEYLAFIKDIQSPYGWKAVFVSKYSAIIKPILTNVFLQALFIFSSLILLSIIIKQFINQDVTTPLIKISKFLSGVKSIDSVNAKMLERDHKIQEFNTISETFNVMINKFKNAYDDLAMNEEKFRLISEFSSVWIYWIDQDEKLVYMSPAVETITGYCADEFDRDTYLMERIIYSSDIPLYKKHKNTIMTQGYDSPIEFRISRKDGEIRWIRHLCRKIYNTKGQYLGIRGSNTDITTRKIYELELLKQKEMLSITLESIGDAVISTDKNGRIIQINKEAQRLTEWTKDEAIYKNLNEVFIIVNEETFEPIENPVDKVIRENKIVNLPNHITLISKSGRKISITDSAAPIIDREGNLVGVVLVFRDVTEKKLLELETIKASKLDSLSVLAGGIAHDFNNILTSIIGNISFCKYFSEVDPKMYERLEVAEMSAKKAKDLVTKLMTFAKGLTPVKKIVSTKKLIEESVSFLMSGSKSTYEILIDDDVWNLYVDEGQITQVLHNLLLNADQSMTESGKIKIEVTNIFVNKEMNLPIGQGRYVKICISDTGIGIPPNKIDKIFDPYFTTKPHGSGLGLASAYSIIKKHEGHITVWSKVGTGTTMCIYLPASTSKAPNNKEENIINLNLKGRVLFMDDDPNVLEIGKEFLQKAGMEVVLARNGDEAIEIYSKALANKNPFSVVILDVTIPGGIGGKETIKRLYDIDPSVVAIVTSGYSEDIVMSQYKEYGFSGVVLKPFDFKHLIKEVRRVLSASEN